MRVQDEEQPLVDRVKNLEFMVERLVWLLSDAGVIPWREYETLNAGWVVVRGASGASAPSTTGEGP